ncbi:MAG: hypothetical protein R2755_29365 [Acidimicrobiales bacterium]
MSSAVDDPGADRLDRGVLVRIVAGVAAVVAVVAVVALLARPGSPPVPGERFDAQFVAACERSGVAAEVCRCGIERWNATVAADELAGLDERLADGGELPDPLRRVLEGCVPADGA